tara:strand:- start:1391 stop:1651 length:261 start_codon:yes stop_codon:yes gene_type:complete
MAIDTSTGINANTTTVFRTGNTAIARIQTATPEQVSRIMFGSAGIKQQVVFQSDAAISNEAAVSLVYDVDSNTFIVQKVGVHGGFF